MSDIFYDIETKELLDQNATDPDAAIRALHMSVGATWCECHASASSRTDNDPMPTHRIASRAAHHFFNSEIFVILNPRDQTVNETNGREANWLLPL